MFGDVIVTVAPGSGLLSIITVPVRFAVTWANAARLVSRTARTTKKRENLMSPPPVDCYNTDLDELERTGTYWKRRDLSHVVHARGQIETSANSVNQLHLAKIGGARRFNRPY